MMNKAILTTIFAAACYVIIVAVLVLDLSVPRVSINSQDSPDITTSTATTTYPPLSGGGTLKLYGADPYTLDPAVASDTNSTSYILQIFNGLVKPGDDLQPVPDIASSWDVSQDNMTYTFHLRHDVVFQDGRKLTAEDVKYSWERACNPLTNSQVAGTYLGDIAGVIDVISGKVAQISGVKVIDNYTLQVTIDAPRSYFLSRLTYPTAMVVDKNNVSSTNWWQNPNGTGPFKLAQWTANSLLVLERNNKYYGEKAGVEKVEFQMLTGLPMNLYETGEIDIMDVDTTYIDRVTDPSGPFYAQLQISPELSFYWIGFNVDKPPFDDVNVRKAFTLAADKDKIISLVLRDMVEKAEGILPPGMPGYNKDLKGYEFNINAAGEALKASKYGDAANLPQITVTTSGYGNDISPVLEALIAQWKENLGVDVKVRVLDPNYYIYNLQTEKDNMFEMGWVADYPHPQDFLDVLFHTGAEYNYGDYSNPDFDEILNEATTEPDTDISFQMYRQAEQMLVDDAAVLPLYFGENYVLVKPYVKNYQVTAMGFAWLSKVQIVGK
jgi:oligopeptide transport system substrate-binding protein